VALGDSSTHKTPRIRRRLRRHPRFTPHLTPTCSSWLNLVASIRTWITNWNDEPRPYVWRKEVDEILDGLAAYCQRIDDSGH
jgi:hypothetical protein